MTANLTNNFEVFAPRLVSQDEIFTSGHRACQGCGPATALRQIGKAIGRELIVCNATGCMEIVASPYPFSAWEVPWIHVAFENTAAIASGVAAGIEVLRRKGKFYTNHEKITVLGIGGDGGTMDIGLQALSGALERGHDFLYICYDNEAYMNTGIQRSSGTPFGASTTTSPSGKASFGQKTNKKNFAEICIAHDIPYVATASVSHPSDLMAKVKKGAEVKGPAVLHVFAPCPTGWRCGSELTIRLARMAVETGIFPLYEYENHEYRLNVDIDELRDIREYADCFEKRPYMESQGRFRHLKNEDEILATIQSEVRERYMRLRAKCANVSGGRR
ncbi:MAG: pyruvate ferredoxin oxidoreductase [Deltaproteobacteria bacterium]|nr:pyruvate ferredoxin oxidoreductase [Deltaproteobacteria bacterium]